MPDAHHAIKAVVRRTGLSAHVIRIWEKRYGAVKPERTDTNRRLYSEEQIERLNLLRGITQSGHSIRHVAKLPVAKLRKLAAESATTISQPANAPLSFLDESIAAVKALDSRSLENVLNRAAVELGNQGLLQRVIAPLAQSIGELWRKGVITAAHEHFASVVIRIFLGQAAKPFAVSDNAPVLLVATPAGQLHELGALLVSASAANLGWHVTYLGASLPAAEIAGAAKQNRARAVALSIVYPEDDQRLNGELTRLHELLSPEVELLVGGRAMSAYTETLEKIGAWQIQDLAHFGSTLEELRKPAKKSR